MQQKPATGRQLSALSHHEAPVPARQTCLKRGRADPCLIYGVSMARSKTSVCSIRFVGGVIRAIPMGIFLAQEFLSIGR